MDSSKCIVIDESNARLHAIISSYLNIVAGIIDLCLSIWAGSEDVSLSMFGVAIMTFVDLSGSILVLVRWQFFFSETIDHQAEKRREMFLSCILGFLMALLGMSLLNICTWLLLEHETPRGAIKGIIVSILGASSSLGLAYYKYIVGKKLDSYVVLTDAFCSLCVGLTCVSSFLVALLQRYCWWMDGAIGIVVGVYTLYGGVKTLLYAYPEYLYLTQKVLDGSIEDYKISETTRLLLFDEEKLPATTAFPALGLGVDGGRGPGSLNGALAVAGSFFRMPSLDGRLDNGLGAYDNILGPELDTEESDEAEV